jgi:hypothetical protein
MNTNTLEEYKRELLSEHKEEIAAIDRLIARERRQTEPSSNGSQSATSSGGVRVRRRMSFPTMVSATLRKITEDFDKDTVFHEIQSQYPSFTGTPSKVARELWKRSRDGELKVVQKGAGRIPAIYRKK